MKKLSFEDGSEKTDEKDVSILPDACKDTVFDSKEDTASEIDEPPDFDEPPIFEEPPDDEEPPKNEDSEPPQDDRKPKGFFFTFGKIDPKKDPEQVSTTKDDTINLERESKTPKSSVEKEEVFLILLHLQFSYSMSWSKFIQNDYGVVGKFLQDIASAWENVIKGYCIDNKKNSFLEKEISLIQKIGFPLLEYTSNIENIEEILKELIRSEKFLQDIIGIDNDEFIYIYKISLTHSICLERILGNINNLTSTEKNISWICSACHFSIIDKEAPSECPVCHSGSLFFIPQQSFFPYEYII